MKQLLKILTVGNFKNLNSLSLLLKKCGIVSEVHSVISGEEAVNLHNSLHPDVILMDVILNGMSGPEAARWIKEQDHAAKVVLVSADMSHQLFLDSDMSCDAHVRKYSTAELYVSLILKLMGG